MLDSCPETDAYNTEKDNTQTAGLISVSTVTETQTNELQCLLLRYIHCDTVEAIVFDYEKQLHLRCRNASFHNDNSSN